MLGKQCVIKIASYEQYGEVNETLSTYNISLITGLNNIINIIKVSVQARIIYVMSFWFKWASEWFTSSIENVWGVT